MLLAIALWAVMALIVFGVGSAIGVFDAGAADLRDVKGTVAEYLAANPSIADRMPAATVEPEGTSLGFVSAGERNVQLGMTALMLLDTAQTVTIARSPECLHEANPLATALLGGEHPSQQRVLITNALYITGQWALGAFLDRKARRSDDWALVRRLYQALTIAGHGWAVSNNISEGIKPFSEYTCADGSR